MLPWNGGVKCGCRGEGAKSWEGIYFNIVLRRALFAGEEVFSPCEPFLFDPGSVRRLTCGRRRLSGLTSCLGLVYPRAFRCFQLSCQGLREGEV